MKTLILIRHAKSSWKHDVADYLRPLKKRGNNDAKLVSKYVVKSTKTPDLILSSHAERANATANIFIKNLEFENVKFLINNDLYDFSGEALLSVVKKTNNNINRLMIFGHNYALTNFVNRYGSTLIENVTTSGFVKIEFNIDSWKNINKGKTVKIVFPKDLK